MAPTKPTALVTAGPTREKIDPVRYISNFSSGIQGYAIAQSLHEFGYDVTLVSGPVTIPVPQGVKVVPVETAEEMLEACLKLLPVDVAVCVAAVCDFRVANISGQKIKKSEDNKDITLALVQNPDILKTISTHALRPKVVVGFAAETDALLENAMRKLNAKGCDIIVANNVGQDVIFGQEKTSVSIITKSEVEQYSNIAKMQVAQELCHMISDLLEGTDI